MGLNNILLRIKAKGYYPILAHPERYVYMGESDYQQLKDMGVKFQFNLPSIAGMYGNRIKKKAMLLLKRKGYYSYRNGHSQLQYISKVHLYEYYKKYTKLFN